MKKEKKINFRYVHVYKGAHFEHMYVQIKKWYGWKLLKISVLKHGMFESIEPALFDNLNSFECHCKIKRRFPSKRKVVLIEHAAINEHWPY